MDFLATIGSSEMKRFVDIRGQGTLYRFAFWDTVTDQFEKHDGEMAWDTFAEFALCYKGADLDRYEGLCPPWALKPAEDDEEKYPSGTTKRST